MSKPCAYCQSVTHTGFSCPYKPRKQMQGPSMAVKTKPCKICGSVYHYASFCPYKPKKKLTNGPVFTRWSNCKAEWFKLYAAEFYTCHYCGQRMTKQETTLDHKISRSRAPQLRYDFANLVPCCWICNGLKGSLDHDEYVHMCVGV
jgi:5-methylcytosine-specific restriction endonuclease McrA